MRADQVRACGRVRVADVPPMHADATGDLTREGRAALRRGPIPRLRAVVRARLAIPGVIDAIPRGSAAPAPVLPLAQAVGRNLPPARTSSLAHDYPSVFARNARSLMS